MQTYTSEDGRTVTVEPLDDGGMMVTDDEGRWTQYGADVVQNIPKDWGIDPDKPN